MKTRNLLLLILLLSLLLSGCEWGDSAREDVDGLSESDKVLTQVAETVSAQLTLAFELQPTDTATATPLPAGTATSTATATATLLASATAVSNQGFNPGVSACDEAAFVADVSIPDNTVFTPGTEFTKIWRLSNVGTCTWTADYKAVFSSGDAMSAGATHNLSASTVAPGQTVDVSINMTAPDTPGDYIGNWVLRNADGQKFGIGKNIGPFYVKIKVAIQGSATATPTVTGTPPTATPTATATKTSTAGPTATATLLTPTATVSIPTATATSLVTVSTATPLNTPAGSYPTNP